MPESGLRQFVARVARRLAYAQECLPDEPVVWHSLLESLRRCATWNDLRVWAEGLPWPLEGSPVRAYALTGATRASAVARLDLSSASLDPVPREELPLASIRRLRGRVVEEAFAWAQEALVAWEPWAPHLDRELFDVQVETPWHGRGSAGGVDDAVTKMIPAVGVALAVRFYGTEAYLVECSELREKWADLVQDGDDWVVLPLSPPAAAWAICYFHHELLEAGPLRTTWPHCPPRLPELR